MTLSRQHTRPIVVGGVEYRWTVVSQLQGQSEHTQVIIEPSHGGQRLVVDVPHHHSDFELGETGDLHAITARDIREWITQARLAHEWNPMMPGQEVRRSTTVNEDDNQRSLM